ncbi:MAG: SpoIID/LytB domain-containing protein [Cyanobacteria bacterium P01_D01_bin.128]
MRAKSMRAKSMRAQFMQAKSMRAKGTPARFTKVWRRINRLPDKLSLSLASLLLATLSWGAIALPVKAALELRVAVRSGVGQIVLGSSTDATIHDGSGRTLSELQGGQAMEASYRGGRITFGDWQGTGFWVDPADDGFVYIGDRWYRGRVFVTPGEGGIIAVNYVDLEHYLFSVLGGEMPTDWPEAALQAQAVAARSYALYKRQAAGNAIYDLGATTTWQVYRGLVEEAESTRSAVTATEGQVLTYNGRIIEAVFHSSSGGHTENVEDVWSQPLPYLRGVKDYDEGAPVFAWTAEFTLEQFASRIGGIGELRVATPERTTPQGRIVTMRLEGTDGARTLSGNDLRRDLGLRSTLFRITAIDDNRVEITGRGFGHGIGLSQWGARNLAEQGYAYDQILTHYYQGARLSRIEVR